MLCRPRSERHSILGFMFIYTHLLTQLQKGQIDAMEFLSMTDQLPIKPVEMKHYSI
jgi:hypothetical protein